MRTERERQEITLQEVSEAVNIKRIYLEAIEKNAYETIPGTVFVKGFIRNYGNFLGLNGSALVRLYKEAVEERTPRPKVRTVTPAKKSKIMIKDTRNKQGKWPEILIVAGVVIFLLLILWLII